MRRMMILKKIATLESGETATLDESIDKATLIVKLHDDDDDVDASITIPQINANNTTYNCYVGTKKASISFTKNSITVTTTFSVIADFYKLG